MAECPGDAVFRTSPFQYHPAPLTGLHFCHLWDLTVITHTFLGASAVSVNPRSGISPSEGLCHFKFCTDSLVPSRNAVGLTAPPC